VTHHTTRGANASLPAALLRETEKVTEKESKKQT
jgi:hypothetical protein